jgi:mismatch-specific thymine-DNA glycosylase
LRADNYSNPSNRFWSALHLAGFTDVRLQPQNERRLLEYRCGITAVVPRPTNRAQDVSPEEFRQARLSFEAKVRHYEPLNSLAELYGALPAFCFLNNYYVQAGGCS